MKTTDDKLLQSLCELALIRVHGIVDDACTCYRGKRCPMKGKHPYGKGWQDSWTHSQHTVASWLDAGFHVGVMLGPVGSRCRVIDVEADTVEAENILNEKLDGITTWSWSSKRGTHRLFLYEDDLPPRSVMKINGIEFRIRSCQSVLPPAAGKEWINSPDSCDLQVIPDCIHEWIDNYKPTTPTNFVGAVHAGPPKVWYQGMPIINPETAEGTLYAGACSYWRSVINDTKNLNRHRIQIESWIGLLNETKVRPRLSSNKVKEIVLAAKEHLEANCD